MRGLTAVALCLLLVQVADAFAIRKNSAAAPATPGYSYKQATRADITLKTKLKARRAHGVDGRLRKRQANPSCTAYPTCSPGLNTGSSYCQLPGWDIYGADLYRQHTYSHEACVSLCEATEGCVGLTWNPNNVDIEDDSASNCYLKNNGFGDSNIVPVTNVPNVAVTFMGSCCDYEDRIPGSAEASACQDNNQPFVFPTCSAELRDFTGSAVFQNVGMGTFAAGGPFPETPETNDPGRIRVDSLAQCSAACLTLDGCAAVVWRPDYGGTFPNCAFKSEAWRRAERDGATGFRNTTTSPTMGLAHLNSNCQSQIGQVDPVVLFHCCDDPVIRVYPTCAASTGDGSAFYDNFDNYGNDLALFPPDNSINTQTSGVAECNSLCFDTIGAACVGTLYRPDDNLCAFKRAAVTELVPATTRPFATSLIGGCSRWSNVVGEAADSVCCENR